MDQLGVRRVRRLPCGRYQPSFRKAGTPHRWTNLEYGASAVFHAAGANPHSERPGPRTEGRSVFLRRFFAISEIESANRRLGLVRVRGSASSDPRGAYAASKTADTPYSKLEAQSAKLGLHSGRPKTPTADWASLVCGVPPVQIRAGLTPHRRRRTRRTPSWRPNPQGWGFILGVRKRQPQIGPRSCAGFRQFRSARGSRRIEDGGHAVLQVGGGAPVGWRAFGLITPRGLVVELRR